MQWRSVPAVSDLHPQPELDTYEVQKYQSQPSHSQEMLRRSAIAVQNENIYEVQYLQTIPDSPASDGMHPMSDLDTYEVQYAHPCPDVSYSQDTQWRTSPTLKSRGSDDAANGAVT